MKIQQKQGQIIPFIQSGGYFFKRGVLAYQKKELSRAVKYLKRAIDLEPEQGIFQCQLAAIYSDMAEYEKSNELLFFVLDELDETMYECYFFLANNFAYQGLFDRAKETASLYLSLVPDGDFALDAKDLLELLQLENGEDSLPEERTQSGDDLIVTYEKAIRYVKDGEYFQAENLLEDIIVAYPSYWPAYSQLARVLYLKGQTEEALAFIKDLLQENHYLPAVCQLAFYYEEMGCDLEALEVAEVLKRTIPIDKDHLYHVASTMCQLKQYEEAYRFFRQFSLRFTPETVDFFFQFGVACYQTGRVKQAEKWWKQAEANNHSGAALLLDKLNHGLLTTSDVAHEFRQSFL